MSDKQLFRIAAKRADAEVKVAEATHVLPEKHLTIRIAIVVVGAIVGVGLLHFLGVSDYVLVFFLLLLGTCPRKRPLLWKTANGDCQR